MAAATQVTVFLGTLTGILHLFGVLPKQPNAKVIADALLAALTVLLLASLAAARFVSLVFGVLASLATAGSLALSWQIYRNQEPRHTRALVALYALAQMAVLVLVAAGLGLFS